MISFFRKIIRKYLLRNKFTFIGKFKSLEEAKNYSSKTTTYLNNESDKQNTEEFIKFVDFEHTDRNIVLPIVSSIIESKELHILDVGGGNPPIYEYINRATLKDTKCWILERKEFVKKINKKIPKDRIKNIFYISSLDELKNKILDIVYFGSSLQYFPNYKGLINKIILMKPKYIIITDTIFHNKDDDDFHVLQINMSPSIFPNLFISEDKFINFMLDNKYKSILNLNIPSIHIHNKINKSEYNFKYLIFQKIAI